MAIDVDVDVDMLMFMMMLTDTPASIRTVWPSPPYRKDYPTRPRYRTI